MKVLAYAKLNLSLRVVGRRADGYHDLDSLVQTIDLADRLSIELGGEGVHLRTDLPLSPAENLAGRAALLLLREKGAAHGACITIEKAIPVGAGLGGGSSDAAAVLMSLDRLLPPRLPWARLVFLASSLGADVPLFLIGGRLRMTGRGERMERLAVPSGQSFVLLVPPVHSSTQEVYARFDRLPAPRPAAGSRLGWNDLERPLLDLHPELRPHSEAIRAVGARYAGMTGSGSAFFACFRSSDEAQRAERDLASSFPEARLLVCLPTEEGSRVEEESDAQE